MSDSEKRSDSNPPNEPKNKHLTSNPLILLVIVLIVASAARFWNLGTESFWYDELAMTDLTDSMDDVVATLRIGNPPLMIILGHIWGEIFGYDEVGVRSLSAVVGVGAVGMLYAVSKQLFDKNIALIAAGLAALSGYLIYYSQDYRYYSMIVLLTLLTYYFFVRALQTEKRWYFALNVLFSVLCYYTHPFGVFMMFAQGIFFLIYAQQYKSLWIPWFVSQIAIILLTLPHIWLLWTVYLDSSSNNLLSYIVRVRYNTPFFATVKYIVYDEIYLRVIPLATANIVFFSGVIYRIRRPGESYSKCIRKDLQNLKALFTNDLNSLLLVLIWFFSIMIIPYLLGFVMGPTFLDRYVIGAAPPFFILLAVALWAMRNSIPLYASVGALLVVMIFGLLAYYEEPRKEEWEHVFNIIEENETANDRIIYNLGIYNPGVRLRFEYAAKIYYEGSLDRCLYYVNQIDDPEFRYDLDNCIGDADHIWIVMREYYSGDDRVKMLENHLNESFNVQLVNRMTYYGIQLLEYRLLP